jgi:hypothetical protein
MGFVHDIRFGPTKKIQCSSLRRDIARPPCDVLRRTPKAMKELNKNAVRIWA